MRHSISVIAMMLGLMMSAGLWAQTEPTTTDDPATAQPTLPTVTPQAPSLEQAYQREFAFLQAQKVELESRLENFRSRAQSEQAAIEADIQRLEGEVIQTRGRAERLDGLVFDAERAVETARANVDVLASTLLQADITLDEAYTPPSADTVPSPNDFEVMFDRAREVVLESSHIRQREGRFFALDGSERVGQIIELGKIGAYGQADDVAGALAPAGGGQLKIWDSADGEASARALFIGQQPETITLFAFESLTNEVEAQEGKSILGVIQSGGMIGWIITLLGLLGAGLIVARIQFLRTASASTETLVQAVATQVSAGDRQGALETLKTFKGATARVLSTAIRNLDREREHLEDVISESLLNESATLNRFGAVIIVIAAVSPLLGLLGTVTGMISTFDVITEFGTGDPKLLSGGISIALVTTQLGLIVAIPLLLIGNVLSGWAERIKDEMEKSALHIVNRYVEGQQGRAS